MNIQWPLYSNIIRGKTIVNTFGERVRMNKDKSPRCHQGWDLAALAGTPCSAVGDGKIVYSGDSGDYGKTLLLELDKKQTDGQELYIFYAHLSERFVSLDSVVKKGEMIARTGTTGNAEGLPTSEQHLHFEVRVKRFVGPHLDGRVSPVKLYGICPLDKPAYNYL